MMSVGWSFVVREHIFRSGSVAVFSLTNDVDGDFKRIHTGRIRVSQDPKTSTCGSARAPTSDQVQQDFTFKNKKRCK